MYVLTLAITTKTRSTSATSSRFIHSLTQFKSNQISQHKQTVNDKQPAIQLCEDKSTKSNGAHTQDRTNHKSLCGVICGYGTADLILAIFAWLRMRSPISF